MKATALFVAILSLAISSTAAQQSSSGSQESCVEVSVLGDATFCVPGPVCGGNISKPTGANCPRVGDVAVSDCFDYVPSYSNSSCVAPVNAECVLLDLDAWGCVWVLESSDNSSSSGSGSYSGSGSSDDWGSYNGSGSYDYWGSYNGSGSYNSSGSGSNYTIYVNPDDIQFPLFANTLSASSDSSSDSSAGVIVIVVLAVVGVAAAVAAAVFYRRMHTQREEAITYENAVFTPAKGHGPLDGKTPLTPPPRDMRTAFMRTKV